MRLIDIESFETKNDVISCEVRLQTSGENYCSVYSINTRSIPTVDAALVVHAKWKCAPNNGVWEAGCTNCGYFPNIRFWSSPYCPNCGAKMDLEE